MIDDENTVQVKGKKIVITNITVITDANDWKVQPSGLEFRVPTSKYNGKDGIPSNTKAPEGHPLAKTKAFKASRALRSMS
jgi:hypothetical protein